MSHMQSKDPLKHIRELNEISETRDIRETDMDEVEKIP